MTISPKFKSRKLWITFLFTAAVAANDVFNLGITTESFALVAAICASYFGANVYEAKAELNAPAYGIPFA